MSRIRVEKAICLEGELRVQGSKNAALPVMAASILHKGCTVLHNCPHITDVFVMEELLKALGAVTCWEDHTLVIDSRGICNTGIPAAPAEKLRGSILLAGGLLGRLGCVEMGYPGGCVIGKRPIDLHLEAFSHLGVVVEEREGRLCLEGKSMTGVQHIFPRPSVGATENAILAAAGATGITRLEGCAREPEIDALCDFLQGMGVDISRREGSVRIRGGCSLRDTEYTIPPDRIAAGTLLLAGAVTRGRIALKEAPVSQMSSLLGLYQKMGGQYLVRGGTLITDSRSVRRPLPRVRTAAYPGFPTDLQPLLLVTCCTLQGESEIEETIFEDRFRILGQLEKMGARIGVKDNIAKISGPCSLKGCLVHVPDLRAGAALLLAALYAEGETVVEDCTYIERGYEDLYGDINLLGGRIRKEIDG